MTQSQTLTQREQVFVSAKALQELQAKAEHLVVLDIRFRPDSDNNGRDRYLAGHLPGAVFVDFASELAGEPKGFSGRRPLPAIHDLQRDALRWGVRTNSTVVVYDDNRNLQAGRAWWVLKWAAVQDVRLLDGGLSAWIAAGGAVTQEVPLPARGDVVLDGGHLPVLDADAAQKLSRQSVLLDARNSDAYTGAAATPEKPREGHIPGALSAHTAQNLNSEGLLADESTLRARFEGLGVDGSQPVGVYCGGGVAASHQVAVLASLGIEASLFVGSWSAWSADPSRPVATGTEPG